MSDFILSAELREDSGKGASRRLRRENGVPAIIYGGKAGGNERKPVAVTLKFNELSKALESEAFYNSIITLNIAGKDEQVLLKDLQRHPAKAIIWHADFLRVSKTTKIKAHVPLHFINEDTCVGVKTGGGKIAHHLTSIDVLCAAGNLPEFIEVDLANVEAGASVYLSDLKLPKGVESAELSHGADHDDAIASVIVQKGEEAAE